MLISICFFSLVYSSSTLCDEYTAYNISVQTVSEDGTSDPTPVKYLPVCLCSLLNVTIDKLSVTSTSFEVFWSSPCGTSEYDKSQVCSTSAMVTRNKDDVSRWKFKDLKPGKSYHVIVTTVSESVTRWPATGNITLRPLPIQDLRAVPDAKKGTIKVSWSPGNFSTQDSYKLSYHQVEGSSTEVDKTFPTDKPNAILEDVLPGRNYSIAIRAISNEAESNERVCYRVTRPSRPIIEYVKSIEKGLKISWKSGFNSHQDLFEVTYNSTKTKLNSTTTKTSAIVLRHLYPGARYEVQVIAVSFREKSEPDKRFQTVLPDPPEEHKIKNVMSNEILVQWDPPTNSDVTEYAIRYRTEGNSTWVKLPNVNVTEAKVSDITPGEEYLIQVNTVSFGVESLHSLHINHSINPSPVANITLTSDSTNVVLKWPRPKGRVEKYVISWWPDTNIKDARTKNKAVENVSGAGLKNSMHSENVTIGDLMPAVKYSLQVSTMSHNQVSEVTKLTTITRPNPVAEITTTSDSTNVTLKWARPNGRIEKYMIKWWPVKNTSAVLTTNIPEETVSSALLKNSMLFRKAIISNLIPGVQYSFQMLTVCHELFSEEKYLTTRTMPIIQSKVEFVANRDLPDSLTLRYTSTPIQSSQFDLYRIRISDPENTTKEKLVNDTDTKVTFAGLTPGRLYNVTVWTVSDNVESQPLLRQDRLFPEPITMLNASNISDTEITMSWDNPWGEYNAFEVQYLTINGSEVKENMSNNSITIRDLRPYRNYTFTLVVLSGNESSFLKRSNSFNASFRTSESYPGEVEKFDLVDIHPRYISFEWSLPSQEENGVIQNFSITYRSERSALTESRLFGPSESKGVIDSLTPGETYIFEIRAATTIGYGPNVTRTAEMRILAPPKPPTQTVPTVVDHSSTTIRIRFKKDYFSEENGDVTSYTIIVAEDDSKNVSESKMPSWRDVQKHQIWPPYQVMEPYNPFKNGPIEEFTIGDEKCIKKIGYCNGQLKPGKTYIVKVRAFTAPDKFTDTNYSFPIHTGTDATVVYVALTSLIVLVLSLLAIAFLMRRRC